MPRRAKPFLHEGWYKTDAGGPPRTKLCTAEQGFAHAELCLARWLARILEVKEKGLLPAGMSPAAYLQRVDCGELELADGRTLPPTLPRESPGDNATNPALLGQKVYLLGEVHDDFLDFKQAEVDPGTYAYYVDKLKPLVKRFGSRPVTSITEEDGLRFKRWLHTQRTWKQGNTARTGMAPCSVNHHLRAAKAMFYWAAKPKRRRFGIAENPWSEIKYLPESGRERLITPEELNALLSRCTDPDFREALIVLRFTTLRPKELRTMEWDFVRFDVHQIVYPPHLIKNRKRRSVTMIDVVEETLRASKERIEREQGKATGLVFPAPGGTEWKHGSFTQKFRRLRDRCVEAGEIEGEKAGERLVCYSTRHLESPKCTSRGTIRQP